MPDPHKPEAMTQAFFTSLAELEITAYEENLTHRFGVGSFCGSTDLNMHVAFIEPGNESRAHFHLRSDIALFVLEGESTMITWNQDYERTERILKKGDFAFIPRGVIHKDVNHTDERFTLIACYNNVGTGPESLKVYVEDNPL